MSLRRWANASLPAEWDTLWRKGRAHLSHSMLGYLSDRLPQSSEAAASAHDAATSAPLQDKPLLAPGPLSWITSSYCIAIILMTVLVQRIQHVVPPRRLFRMSAGMRFLLRLPSAAYLLYALSLVVYKWRPALADSYPILADLQSSQDDASILWTVFLALGLQSITECFCKALNNDHAQTSVNLLSYSYLLHFHSHPSSAPQMRPTPPVWLLISLTLAETLSLQLMEAVGANVRLFITFFFSAIGQAVMLNLVLREDLLASSLLPSLQYFNRFPELLFFSMSLLTVGLHAISQLVSEGRVTKAIFGHSSNLPGRGDDFSIAVIRYGTACLETSALTGFGNEVGVVVAPPAPYIELGRGGSSAAALASFPSHMIGRGLNAPEVKDVRARAGVPKDVDPLSRSPSIIRECWRFSKAAGRLSLVVVRRQVRWVAPYLGLTGRAGRNNRTGALLRFLGVQSEADAIAQRWLARSADADDPFDEDFVPFEAPTTPDSSDSSDSEDAGDDDTVDEAFSRDASVEPNALALVTDLEMEGETSEDMQAVLLAHLTRGSLSGPLTRRRFRAPREADAAVQGVLQDRRVGEPSDNAEVQALCVVCRSEMRTVIFWPCRCLAVCEECKEHLGARSQGGSQHLCVCCRRPIDGWSRIFVP